ncbi:Zinc finger, RING/FYVE/PHD-type [Cynara cardunculus var. scolymus]|uniref:Zinc finger, RING/FYVE/PHD-type n=1 Tax=Cynara cardunculus var. scolymus TaxID=59895 RepID=A0A103YHY8_CYNCS|nr:Zinc finger, RING/FYVE/PHD-type [Cynara cardunculus var. scolymus]
MEISAVVVAAAERLGIKDIVCCGSTWGIGPSTMSIGGDDDGGGDLFDLVDQHIDIPELVRIPPELNSNRDCVFPSPRMNLAAALAAERHSRSTTVEADGVENQNENENNNRSISATPRRSSTPARESPGRMSLMRLLEETDGHDEKEGTGMDLVCCVCMGRKKGAAFIPCGHTFCRVCSRELWLNRGTCPLCNRSITEILDIY